jgi:threonine dehydratase
MTKPPSFADILAARDRIAREAIRTPLLFSPFLSERLSAKIYLKPECLQRTGSFKFRGAYNAISALDPALRARGVVAVSSGEVGASSHEAVKRTPSSKSVYRHVMGTRSTR